MKQYAFNTEASMKVGDMFASDDYTTPMQVVEVLDKAFKYVNLADGKLSDKRDSTRQFELRVLKISKVNESKGNTVVASRI